MWGLNDKLHIKFLLGIIIIKHSINGKQTHVYSFRKHFLLCKTAKASNSCHTVNENPNLENCQFSTFSGARELQIYGQAESILRAFLLKMFRN